MEMPTFQILTILGGILTALFTFFFKIRNIQKKLEEDSQAIQERQREMLQQINDFSRQMMTITLQIAPQFAFSPYPQQMQTFSPSDISLFDIRGSHFTPEKKILADYVVDEVIRRSIDPDAGGDEKLYVILILDAGSTVYPIFRKLCSHPSFQFNKINADRLKIITNNLAGVSDLIKYGRIGDPIHAQTLFDCRILHGYANSLYEASLSEKTYADLNAAVAEFKAKVGPHQTVLILSVTSGNYVSIQDGILVHCYDDL